MRREVGQGAAAVHLLAGGAVGFGHGSRAAAEHADFADLQRQSRKEERVSDSDKYSEAGKTDRANIFMTGEGTKMRMQLRCVDLPLMITS